MLILVGKRHAVARGDLSGDSERIDRPGVAIPRFDIRVLRPRPLCRVARIEIRSQPRQLVQGAVIADVAEEPELVPLDGSATGDAEVVGADDTGGLGEAVPLQLVVEVVASGPVARVAEEPRSAERVATRFWDQVHLRTAVLGFAQGARQEDLRLLGGGRGVREWGGG